MRKILKIAAAFLVVNLALFTLHSCNSVTTENTAENGNKTSYTCPMHPQVVSDRPGTCPICGMDLVPFDKSNISNHLTLSESQQTLANISTETIQTGSFSSTKRLNGRLVVDPAQTEFISSRVAGRIEELYVKQTGETVRRGQPLYKIYSEQLAALQQELVLAVEQVSQFPEDKKFQQLADAAEQKLLLYGQSESRIRQLKKGRKASPYVTYTAPAGGIVAELFVTEGQYVGEGSSIMSLEAYQEIWVEADLYPAEAELVKKGAIVQVTVAGFENESQPMRIEFLAPSLEAGSQLMTIRGSIPNLHNQLRPGTAAVIEIPVSNASNAITLPVDAVIHDGKGAHIWVETGPGEFTPKMVETGHQNLNRIEIKKGVKPGDVVVVTGAYLLYSEFVLKKGSNPMAAHDH